MCMLGFQASGYTEQTFVWMGGGKNIHFLVTVQRMTNYTRNSCSALETIEDQLIPTMLPQPAGNT